MMREHARHGQPLAFDPARERVVPRALATLGVRGNDADVYSVLWTDLARQPGTWTGTAGAIAGELCVDARVVRRSLNNLADVGLIEEDKLPASRRKQVGSRRALYVLDGEEILRARRLAPRDADQGEFDFGSADKSAHVCPDKSAHVCPDKSAHVCPHPGGEEKTVETETSQRTDTIGICESNEPQTAPADDQTARDSLLASQGVGGRAGLLRADADAAPNERTTNDQTQPSTPPTGSPPRSPPNKSPPVPISIENLPRDLRDRDQWVVWRLRDDGGKPPFQPSGQPAKPGDPRTWHPFDRVWQVYQRGGYSGIGYMFADDDPLVGVDLDGCRDPATGALSPWAQEVIRELNTYAEVSPSGTGVKLFLRGKWPLPRGRNRKLDVEPMVEGKLPAIEVYDHARYFAVTGQRLPGPTDPQSRQSELEAVCRRLIPVCQAPAAKRSAPRKGGSRRMPAKERAKRYVEKMPRSVSGDGGHNALFAAACAILRKFDLAGAEAYEALEHYNRTSCDPPWDEDDLRHKLDDAHKEIPAEEPGQFL